MLEGTTNSSDDIYYLTNKEIRNWRQILQLGKILDLNVKRNFSWIWPTEENLLRLGECLKNHGIGCVLSVGCGTGLLEWILRESLNIDVFGLEADKKWWQNKYKLKQIFIERHFIDDLMAEKAHNFLQQCCRLDNWNFALLFCYFNNRSAFLEYLQMYKGHWIIVIGPKPDEAIHTDPNPLSPQFPTESKWQLRGTLDIGDTDILAIYGNV